MNRFLFVAPCRFGLERTLSFELRNLGAENVRAEDGRVFFEGGAEICARANIRCSVAERICAVLGSFRAVTFDELYEGILKLPLAEYIRQDDDFPNKGSALSSKLSSVPALQRTIKKAMAVNLCKAYGTDVLPETGAKCKIRFSLKNDVFTLMLDTSGNGLHKRGYRAESNAAPIRETLGGGIADIARIRENDLVVDPFCGSGTLLIESAYKALGIAPGLMRTFAGERMKFLPKEVWETARSEARARIKSDVQFRAIGYDSDPDCVRLTNENAKKAGVSEYVRAELRDIDDFKWEDRPAKILTNPPYGERMLELSQAREIYAVMGRKLLPRGENQLYVITSDEMFEEIFGLKADSNRKLYNGMLMCRLYAYFK